MRLFVGIAIPEDICERLAGLRTRFRHYIDLPMSRPFSDVLANPVLDAVLTGANFDIAVSHSLQVITNRPLRSFGGFVKTCGDCVRLLCQFLE